MIAIFRRASCRESSAVTTHTWRFACSVVTVVFWCMGQPVLGMGASIVVGWGLYRHGALASVEAYRRP